MYVAVVVTLVVLDGLTSAVLAASCSWLCSPSMMTFNASAVALALADADGVSLALTEDVVSQSTK